MDNTSTNIEIQKNEDGNFVGTFAFDRDLVMYYTKKKDGTDFLFWKLEGNYITIHKMTFGGTEYDPYSYENIRSLQSDISSKDPEASIFSIPRIYATIEFSMQKGGK